MTNKFILLIPLNHLKIENIFDLGNRMIIFPNNYIWEKKILNFNEKELNKYYEENRKVFLNDFQIIKFNEVENNTNINPYNIPHAAITLYSDELKEDQISLFAQCFYAILRIWDVFKFGLDRIERKRRWSEWQIPYTYSPLLYKKNLNNLEQTKIYELGLNKLSLDINLNSLDDNLYKLVEILISAFKNNSKMIKALTLYNEAYEMILKESYEDYLITTLIIFEYLYTNKKDEIKSDVIAQNIKKYFLNESYGGRVKIEDIIKESYRERNNLMHRYKGLNRKSLYNFTKYYFNPIDVLKENRIKDYRIFLFLILNEILILEMTSNVIEKV